jgi:hypothetical protein
MASSFEYEARRKKVAALTRHVTELVSFLGLSAETDGYLIADLIRGWSDLEWNQAGINIGVKPKPGNKPLVGVETRLAVINGFVERARRSA